MIRLITKAAFCICFGLVIGVSVGCSYDTIDPDSTADGAKESVVEDGGSGSDSK